MMYPGRTSESVMVPSPGPAPVGGTDGAAALAPLCVESSLSLSPAVRGPDAAAARRSSSLSAARGHGGRRRGRGKLGRAALAAAAESRRRPGRTPISRSINRAVSGLGASAAAGGLRNPASGPGHGPSVLDHVSVPSPSLSHGPGHTGPSDTGCSEPSRATQNTGTLPGPAVSAQWHTQGQCH